MFKKSFFQVLFGLMLLACMSSQSYADKTHHSMMRVVSKAAVDGGAEVARRALFIVRNPIIATKNAIVTSKTVVGSVVTAVGSTVESVWGYLVEVEKGEPLPEGAKEKFAPDTIKITAIETATQDVNFELSATLYDQAEPVIYSIQRKITQIVEEGETALISGQKPLFDWAPEAFKNVYNAILAVGGIQDSARLLDDPSSLAQ